MYICILICKLAPVRRGLEETEEEADHSRLIGSRFNMQGNLNIRLAVGGLKMSKSLHPPARILKVYIQTLTGFSHIHNPGGLNNTLLSQGYVLETASTVGMGGKHITRAGEGMRSP